MNLSAPQHADIRGHVTADLSVRLPPYREAAADTGHHHERTATVKTLNNVTTSQAEAGLLLLAEHLPTGTSFGKPLVASRDNDGDLTILCAEPDGDSGIAYYPEPHCVTRLVGLDGGDAEATEFRNGREVVRIVAGPVE